MTRYAGITGFMNCAEVDACLSALPKGLTLMCGVLVSEKTLRGERNKWHRRYPRIEDIAGIFSPDPRCLNLLHYCSDTAPTAETMSRLRGLGGPYFHGFQFNGEHPTRHTLAAMSPHVERGGRRRRTRVVMQVCKFNDLPTWADPRVTDVLLDGSGGRGLSLDPAAVRDAVRTVRSNVPRLGVGIAGGLCAEALPAVAPLVHEYGLSVDAEGRLRDGDEGGVLNLDKARAYLRAAGEAMRPEVR